MILVAGGTGRLGRRVVARLTAAGERVRVLTRDPVRAGGLPAGTEVVTGDVRTGPLDEAVRGCTSVVSAVHGFLGPRGVDPRTVDHRGNRSLMDAAVSAGVERFVLVSVAGAAPDHPLVLHRMKYLAEQDLQTSGLTGVVVHAPPFLETWVEVVGGRIASGGPALVLGPGRNPITFVSVEDVAAVVVLGTTGDARVGGEVTVTGPEDLSFVDLAERVVARAGGGRRIAHVPLPALRALSVLARPTHPAAARAARAAVVMNTTDMTVPAGTVRDRFPDLPRTTVEAVLDRATPAAAPTA